MSFRAPLHPCLELKRRQAPCLHLSAACAVSPGTGALLYPPGTPGCLPNAPTPPPDSARRAGRATGPASGSTGLALPVRAQCKHNTDPSLAGTAWKAFDSCGEHGGHDPAASPSALSSPGGDLTTDWLFTQLNAIQRLRRSGREEPRLRRAAALTPRLDGPGAGSVCGTRGRWTQETQEASTSSRSPAMSPRPQG